MKVSEVTVEAALRQARLEHHEGNFTAADRIHDETLDAAFDQPDSLREIGIAS